MKRTITLVAFAALAVLAGSAVAQTPQFENGGLVARKLEAHFNGADYKARLAKSGGRLSRRVLCAYEKPLVTCGGEMRTAGLRVDANWKLAKISSGRARLSWVFRVAGSGTRNSTLVAPAEFGLTRF